MNLSSFWCGRMEAADGRDYMCDLSLISWEFGHGGCFLSFPGLWLHTWLWFKDAPTVRTVAHRDDCCMSCLNWMHRNIKDVKGRRKRQQKCKSLALGEQQMQTEQLITRCPDCSPLSTQPWPSIKTWFSLMLTLACQSGVVMTHDYYTSRLTLQMPGKVILLHTE